LLEVAGLFEHFVARTKKDSVTRNQAFFAVKIDNKVELDRCSTGRAVNARVGKAAHAIRGAPDCEKLFAWSFSSEFPRTWENGYRLGKGMRDGKDNRLCCHDESGAWSVLPRVAWS